MNDGRRVKAAVIATGPADFRDQAWLDERVSAIENGIDAVLDIAVNWFDGRGLARLHPGVSPAEYVKSKVGSLRLGKADVTVLLAETNWSNRQIAAVAGVTHPTVAATGKNLPVERPRATLGGDGKLRTTAPFQPRLDPMPYFGTADPPPEPVQPEKGAVRHRATLTEVRQQVRILQGIFAMLRPDEVVPTAEPVLREIVPAVLAWAQLWATEHEDV